MAMPSLSCGCHCCSSSAFCVGRCYHVEVEDPADAISTPHARVVVHPEPCRCAPPDNGKGHLHVSPACLLADCVDDAMNAIQLMALVEAAAAADQGVWEPAVQPPEACHRLLQLVPLLDS